ncbi:hypothetical protein YC2023_107704 [Brassica napus]
MHHNNVSECNLIKLDLSWIKTESGAKVRTNKVGAIYKKWKDNTHKKASAERMVWR